MEIKFIVLLGFTLSTTIAASDSADPLCADRTAVERVYYEHRLGEKPPFEQVSPPSLIEKLVQDDQRKEAALRKIYDVEITTALLDAEVRRINTTTRAPEILAELKAALGNDPARFARTVARPIVVERLLREKFENDDALHASQRHAAEKIRDELLTLGRGRGNEALTSNTKIDQSLLTSAAADAAFSEDTWQLGPRPQEKPASTDEIEIKKRFGPDAKLLSAPADDGETKRVLYFADLPGELQNVLRVQLRQGGDVSAVIETPDGFHLYFCRERTTEHLRVASMSLPKRNLDEWLATISPDTK